MNEKSGFILMGIVASLVVAGSVVAAGYFGFETLRGDFRAQHSETQSTVVALKTETVKAVEAASTAAMEKIAGGGGSGGGQIAAEIAALKTMAETIRSEQKTIVDSLTAIAKQPGGMSAGAGAMAGPPAESEMARDIYFPLAVFGGPEIDTQIAQILPSFKARLATGACFVSVSGYSDTLGNDQKNLQLSQQRADYVAGVMRKQGFTVESAVGWGERRLKVHTLDATKNEQNRRVVVDMHCGEAPKKAAVPAS